MANLKDRWVLVTGGSRGIGRAIGLHLARDGYNIVLNYRTNDSAAEETRREIVALGSQVRLVKCDIAEREQLGQALTTDISENGVYFGVVCNAGITSDTPFPAMTEEAWDGVVGTNLGSFYNLLRPLVLPMVQSRQKGRIVVISSVAGITGNRGQVNYSAAKAGLIGASKALALELAKREITVNCIAPGLIDTDMLRDAPKEELLRHVPMRRLGKPEEVAATVSFLFSEMAGYITGQVISVNGGLI